MGRPIKKIWIGERAGFGPGAGVASVTVGGTNNSTGYTDLDAVTIGAPDQAGGVQAAGYILETGGVIDSVVITEAGSGYTSAPTVTAPTGTLGTTTLTAVLTASGGVTITASGFLEGGSNLPVDIIAQKGNDTYRVTDGTRTGECSLTSDGETAHGTPNAAGEMVIVATDSGNGTYYVTKLYNNTVRLEQFGAGPWEFVAGDKVEWAKDGVAVVNVSVSISA